MDPGDIPDEGYYYDLLRNCCRGVPLVHLLLVVREVTHSPFISNQHHGANGPFVPDGPWDGSLVLVIEHFTLVNEEGTRNATLRMLLPHKAHHVYPSLYYYLHTFSDLLCHTSLI